jgi:uncharacterized protein
MSDEPTIRVVYTKYDGSLHWNHPALRLGEDEHGVWAGCPAGSEARRGHEPPVTQHHPCVMLFPRDAWWTACFNAPPHRTEIYCDVSTVPRWPDEHTVTMVDLDLDVIRRRHGRKIILDDEDEFDEHRVAYGYPAEVVASARRSAGWLLEAVAGRTQPFHGSYREWLKRVE